jgi:hypothetical protein
MTLLEPALLKMKIVKHQTVSEDADESHQSEESEDARLERWYRENGMFDNMEDIEEAFNEHLQEIQDPNHPLNRHNFDVVCISDVCMSPRQKMNDSDENLNVEF